VAVIRPWNTTSYLVLTSRSFAGVKVALLPLHVMLCAATGMCLTGLSRNVCLFIDLQFIGRLKFTVTLVLTGTLTASSVGIVEITVGFGFDLPEAEADPTTPRITTNAAIDILPKIHLSIVVLFLVEYMAFISLVRLRMLKLEVFRGIVYRLFAIGDLTEYRLSKSAGWRHAR
jgi:hypothetical protein